MADCVPAAAGARPCAWHTPCCQPRVADRTEQAELLPPDKGAVVDAIVELANDTGATWIAGVARREPPQHLCTRLRAHLAELARALVRAHATSCTRLDALTIARVIAESVLEARTHLPDARRDALASALAIERTKFLMASKADALMALDARLATSTRPRHQLRTVAASASHAISIELLADLCRRMSAHADKPIATLATSLLDDFEHAIGDLDESISPQALAGFDAPPPRSRHSDIEWPATSRFLSQVVDRFGLASRHRIHHAARDALVLALARGSQQVIARVLADYDEAKRAIESRFCDCLDAALRSAQLAAAEAKTARAGGPDAVARARTRIARWSLALDEIATRLA